MENKNKLNTEPGIRSAELIPQSAIRTLQSNTIPVSVLIVDDNPAKLTALAEITQQRGVHYDPKVVDACLTLFREQHYAFKN